MIGGWGAFFWKKQKQNEQQNGSNKRNDKTSDGQAKPSQAKPDQKNNNFKFQKKMQNAIP